MVESRIKLFLCLLGRVCLNKSGGFVFPVLSSDSVYFPTILCSFAFNTYFSGWFRSPLPHVTVRRTWLRSNFAQWKTMIVQHSVLFFFLSDGNKFMATLFLHQGLLFLSPLWSHDQVSMQIRSLSKQTNLGGLRKRRKQKETHQP